ncbi:MAG TPA: hypothetical protein PLD88_12175, partial [Candidatus Berkiella sp.]|nr:hypothetical protein [Candidatus Berkiella sp.]
RVSLSLTSSITSSSETFSVVDFLTEPPSPVLPIPSSIPPALSLATWSHRHRPAGMTKNDKYAKRKSGLDT